MSPAFAVQDTVLSGYRDRIEAELKAGLSGYGLPLYDMIRYHLGWIDREGNPQQGQAGKALRGALCLMTCAAAGGEVEVALPAAAAVELVHNYSLVHDDIQDNDRERRHRPTVWTIWGQPQAINAGTAMRILADLSIARLDSERVPEERQLKIHRRLDEATLQLLEGQFLDISFESREAVSLDEYSGMISKKTAALIACAMEIGARVASTEDDLPERFARLGRALGMAFQIRDDILGIWGDSRSTGKPIGSDILRRKKSFPVVYALQHGDPTQQRRLRGLYSEEAPGPAQLQGVLEILEAVEARDAAQRAERKHNDDALLTLDGLALSAADRSLFEGLLSFLAGRSA
jgi:geranylgeranyl diphosphate synthase type I